MFIRTRAVACTALLKSENSVCHRCVALASKKRNFSRRNENVLTHFTIWNNEDANNPDACFPLEKLRNIEESMVAYVKKYKSKVKIIDGSRYEVYVTAPQKGVERREDAKLFERFAPDDLKTVVKEFLEWANNVALQRLLPAMNMQDNAEQFVFDSHSFLISLGPHNLAQNAHIDLHPSMVQFAVFISDKTTPTLVDHTAKRLTAQEACLHLGLSDEQAEYLKSSQTLANFGDLCLPKHELERRLTPAMDGPVRAGTTMGCKGGVVHAGPSSEGLRVVLFFVGKLVTDQSYDSDSQQTAWTVPFDIADEVEDAGNKSLAAHLKKQGFLRAIEWSSESCKAYDRFADSDGALTDRGESVKRACSLIQREVEK